MDIFALAAIVVYVLAGILSWLRWAQISKGQRIGVVLVLLGFPIQASGILFENKLLQILGAFTSVLGLIVYFRLYHGLFGIDDHLLEEGDPRDAFVLYQRSIYYLAIALLMAILLSTIFLLKYFHLPR